MKKMKKFGTVWLALLWVILAAAAAGGATFAWFTFNPATNVEPMGSTISDGETALYISNTSSPDSFSDKCELNQFVDGTFEPISTADLSTFYQATMQTKAGISYKFKDTTALLDTKAMHGMVYLKSLKDNCKVYFYRPNLEIAADEQTLASLRLALRITSESGAATYIFQLNNLGNTTGAEVIQTISEPGNVIAGAESDGSPKFVKDPSVELAAYCTVRDTNGKIIPAVSNSSQLFTLDADEIAQVEYWLYLEGCDENCINSVQDKDITLQLSFAGIAE